MLCCAALCRLQDAACSALCTLVEEGEERVAQYLPVSRPAFSAFFRLSGVLRGTCVYLHGTCVPAWHLCTCMAPVFVELGKTRTVSGVQSFFFDGGQHNACLCAGQRRRALRMEIWRVQPQPAGGRRRGVRLGAGPALLQSRGQTTVPQPLVLGPAPTAANPSRPEMFPCPPAAGHPANHCGGAAAVRQEESALGL